MEDSRCSESDYASPERSSSAFGSGSRPMKGRYSSAGSSLSPRARILSRKSRADLAAEDALVAEAREGVGVQHLGPLVGVVAGAVAHRAGEQVREGRRSWRSRRAAARRRTAAGCRARRPPRSPSRVRRRSACAAPDRRSRSPSCRICALAARKVWARFIFWNRSSGIGAPVSQWRANRSSASRSQHQFSMICEGSSTKSQATLVPARLRTSTRLSR